MNVLEFGASKLWNPRPLYSYPRQTLHDTLPEDGWLPQASGGPGPLCYHSRQRWSSSGGRSSPPPGTRLAPLPAVRPSLQANSWAVLCCSSLCLRGVHSQCEAMALLRVDQSLKKSKSEVKSSHQNIPRDIFLQNDYVTYWQMLQPGLKDRTDIHTIYIYTAILKWNIYNIASWPPSKNGNGLS